MTDNTKPKIRIAIIGSGPAGFYAAEHLFKKSDAEIHIDMFDKLPTPHGLVRSGVAPDHQKIKSVSKVFDKIALKPDFRFFGNIEYGKHIKLDELKKYYNQIVFATGAQTDRKMGIPGEDLKGSHTATEFVAWYNAHPDYTDLDFDLSVESVAIVGVGNVAVDVARILCRNKKELLETDIATYALEKLAKSNIKTVYMLGRRGPAQAAFTNPEVRELGKLEDTRVRTIPEEVEIDELTKEELDRKDDKYTEKKLEIIKSFSEEGGEGKDKTLYIRFLVSPVEIIGDENGNVKKLKIVKNELYRNEKGDLRPRATDVYEELDVGLVFRSIGYSGIPLPGLPFDDKRGVIPNIKGRITEEESDMVLTGLYATGWIKRGPTGVIGTNKSDSGETVECMLEDINSGKLINTERYTDEEIKDFIREKNPRFITYREWLKLDELEKQRGREQGRPRVKFTNISEILEVLDKEKDKNQRG